MLVTTFFIRMIIGAALEVLKVKSTKELPSEVEVEANDCKRVCFTADDKAFQHAKQVLSLGLFYIEFSERVMVRGYYGAGVICCPSSLDLVAQTTPQKY